MLNTVIYIFIAIIIILSVIPAIIIKIIDIYYKKTGKISKIFKS